MRVILSYILYIILINYVMPGGLLERHINFFLKRTRSTFLLKTKTLNTRNLVLNGR